MADVFEIVKQHRDMIQYVDALQRANAEYLGFMPTCVLEREQENGRIFLSLLNNEPCGYIYAGAVGRDVACHQVCIQYDARRRKYGSMLVAALEEYASGARSIVLRCGFDLDANEFWHTHGYRVSKIVDGGVRRMRRINVWVKQIGTDLFGFDEIAAERGTTSATVWAKHKQTGLITQFHRGRSLSDYRARIIQG